MVYKILIFLSISCFLFAETVPSSLRSEFALKMHRGFCLQSVGQSTAAFYTFNEGYQDALKAGISPQKLYVIGNLFTWYRKFGHYLGLFETFGKENITDEYRETQFKFSSNLFGSRMEKRKEAFEIAEISRDMIFGVAEIIGGLLAVVFIPDLKVRVGTASGLVWDGGNRIWLGFNRLKTKNDAIAYETRLRIKEIEAAASTCSDDEW